MGWRVRPPHEAMQEQVKQKNLRTALILASVALVFFIGVFVKHIWFH
jgi:hypothetical protein